MKYSKKRACQICELIATGNHTIVEICKKVNINQDTFFEWRNTKSEFSELIKKADEQYLDSIKIKARSGLAVLLEKHEFEETKVEYVESKPGKDGEPGKPKIKSQTRTKKVIMPNITAIIYTLNNADQENFKQRQIIAHTGKDDGPIETEYTIKIGYGNSDENEPTDAEV